MALIRATCTDCGDVELRSHDIRVRTCRNTVESTYLFRCPVCRMTEVRPAESHVVDVLLAAGVCSVLSLLIILIAIVGWVGVLGRRLRHDVRALQQVRRLRSAPTTTARGAPNPCATRAMAAPAAPGCRAKVGAPWGTKRTLRAVSMVDGLSMGWTVERFK